MAIYRPRRSRWPLLVGLTTVSFVVGALAGAFVVGSQPVNLTSAAASVRDGLAGSAGLLEVAQIEYAEALSPGGGETEYQGALANLDRSRARYDAVSAALAELNPERAQRIATGFGALRSMMEQRTEASLVADAVANLREELL